MNTAVELLVAQTEVASNSVFEGYDFFGCEVSWLGWNEIMESDPKNGLFIGLTRNFEDDDEPARRVVAQFKGRGIAVKSLQTGLGVG